MKSIALLLLVLALAACDKPTSTAELSCDMDKHWQRVNALYLAGSYPDNEQRGTEVNVTVTTYDNYATVTYDNITTNFERVAEERYWGEFGNVSITYKGNFPGSERTALLNVDGDIANKKIRQYGITFIGEKEAYKEHEYGISRSCIPIKEEYKGNGYSAAVPFYHKYKMPNKIERCINEIVQTVFCLNSVGNPDQEKESCDFLMLVTHNGKSLDLTQKDALSISSNWDYKNIKLYQNDGKLEEHEKDACEVLDRLNKFIHDTGLDSEKSEKYITIQREMESCDDCGRVLASGDDGDFIIQLPETNALKNITRADKNAKFLSVFNLNHYAKAGYCLVNVIPYNTMKKLDLPNKTCSYRIYCGAPELMDYNQYYAVEVCQ